MTINFLNVPTKGFPLGRNIEHSHLFQTKIIVLNSIAVKDDFEISEFMMSCGHGRLPNRTFLNFTITKHDKCSSFTVFEPCCKGTTHAERESHPEASSTEVYTWTPFHVDMALANSSKNSVRVQIIMRNESFFSQKSIHARRCVSL